MLDLVNIAEISVRRVIHMAKTVKSFKALPQSDQISLLKGGSIELLILRSVITFDKEKQHFLDPGDKEDTSAMNMEQVCNILMTRIVISMTCWKWGDNSGARNQTWLWDKCKD